MGEGVEEGEAEEGGTGAGEEGRGSGVVAGAG